MRRDGHTIIVKDLSEKQHKRDVDADDGFPQIDEHDET